MSLVTSGKTKTLLTGPSPGTVWLVTEDALTAGDAARRAEIAQLGREKTEQAAIAFATLAAAGIPTAFLEHHPPDRLLCRQVSMLPLEFVVRRFAFGSYLKRHPEAAPDPGAQPKRFACLVSEVFHKQAVVCPPLVASARLMPESEARERYLRDGQWPAEIHTDPYCVREGQTWTLYSAKAPAVGAALLRIPAPLEADLFAIIMGELILPAFAALEAAWAAVPPPQGPLALADAKMEVGLTADGTPLIADVIDNDSWRLWPDGDPTRQLDKQVFRDGGELEAVAANYATVTALMRTWPAAAR